MTPRVSRLARLHAALLRSARLHAAASVLGWMAALACTAALAGCGAQPPQAPASEANRVASALEGIELACGENAQQRALPGFAPSSSAPEQEAASRAVELAHVARRNPAWVYQGSTLGEVAAAAAQKLRECGLGGAARALASAG